MNTTYVKYEILRLLRNKQNFIFSLIFPVALFFFIAGSNKNEKIVGLPFPTYYMAGMMAFGTMGAVIGGGARIAFEREQGWIRQLRLSPLTPRAYLRAKVLTSYLMAAITIVLMIVAGIILGVSMPVQRWFELVGLVLVGLIPFAALGILLGHLIKSDTMGPIMGGGISFLSIFGGAFGPLGNPGSTLNKISQFVPSYWIVQAGHVATGAHAWSGKGWAIVAGWSVLLIYGAIWAYRRDGQRG
ncbi:MAG: ABC transporter permease [Jatrophihabitans sp.]